jgi:hypothetical protein
MPRPIDRSESSEIITPAVSPALQRLLALAKYDAGCNYSLTQRHLVRNFLCPVIQVGLADGNG